MGGTHRKHPVHRSKTRQTRQFLNTRNEVDDKREETIQRRRNKGIAQKIKGKRILLAKVAKMAPEELLDHRAKTSRDLKLTAETRASLSKMGPEEFRKAWMAGLRKAIHDLHEHISGDE